jgi:hypothetical protein
LNADGDFISAEVLPDKTIVMLPVTEDSEGRTSGYNLTLKGKQHELNQKN